MASTRLTAVRLFDRAGEATGEVDLPDAFTEPVRTDLIRKAVNTARANRRQRYGAHRFAGKRHAVDSWGPGRGVSRVPRLTRGRQAAQMPGSRGGRRAHPPKAEKEWAEKMNRKERRKALRAALAATADPERVRGRGHRLPDDASVPLVCEDDLLALDRTKELIAWLEKVGLSDELDRADQKKVRAGKGKGRGRRYRRPVSVLFVLHDDGPLVRAASNVPGVETTRVDQLNAEMLAPGGDPGRLLVLTKSALEALP